MHIKVTKLTDISLLRAANSATTGQPSHMSLADAYRRGHSNIRTQLFWIECRGIPLCAASQLVRSHVGVQFFQRSKRPDRGGEDFPAECAKLCQGLRRAACAEDPYEAMRDACVKTANALADFPNRFDRHAPTDLAMLVNAEALMNMAHKRLCSKASPETREVVRAIRDEIMRCDPDLALHLVPQCIYRNALCPEPKGCKLTCGEDVSACLSEYAERIMMPE